MPRAHVFIATSLDGFIAGPDDELDWLPGHDEVEDSFTPFMASIGAILMGRRTFDIVDGFPDPWPYGDTPILVATSRPLESQRPTVRASAGSIETLLAEAAAVAGERDIYVDGGAMIRSALDADRIDLLTITVIPIVLGAGIPLFAGCSRRHGLALQSSRPLGGGLVQLVYTPA